MAAPAPPAWETQSLGGLMCLMALSCHRPARAPAPRTGGVARHEVPRVHGCGIRRIRGRFSSVSYRCKNMDDTGLAVMMETSGMQNNAVPKAERLNAEIQQVQVAASKLIARLADRAAYASPDEYQEIRGVMAALRALGKAPE